MQAESLDELALRRRLERKVRAQCIEFGLPRNVVDMWSLERLLIERRRVVKRLMESGGRRWDG